MTGTLVAYGGWLAAALAAATVLAGRRSQAGRMETVTRACHELRGPITAARLGLQLGLRIGELSPGRLRSIDLELGRAALALDDLAEVRARRRRRGRDQELDMGELLSDSVEAWSAWAADSGVELRLVGAGHAVVLGDRLRLAQAVGNLLANAIEHGGGVVDVRLRSEWPYLRIEITDTGPGLPAPVAHLMRGAKRGRGSRGRGLAIVAAIAEDHGGRLAAAPSDSGARLVLELPVRAPRGVEAEAGPGA
jgi:signal transduction histidine kinase